MKSFKSQSGQSIILVLIAIASLGFMGVSILDLVRVSREQKAVSANIVAFRSALNSVVDYTIAGVKQRACFDTANWLWTAPGPTCLPGDANSAERLIMNDDTAAAVADFNANNPPALQFLPNPIRIGNIVSPIIPFASFTGNHPLSVALGAVTKTNDVDGIQITITRNEAVNIPQHGRDIQISITASIAGTAILARGTKILTQTSTLSIMPREISQFALVVPQDMHLDLTQAQSGAGDANVSLTGQRNAIYFQSPVFINRDLILPAPAGGVPTKSSVVFSGKIVLGNGHVKQADGTLLTPSVGSSDDRFYDQIKSVSGIMAGVETDNVQDNGLSAFAGLSPAPTLDISNFSGCKIFNAIGSDLSKTREARSLMRKSTYYPVSGAAQIGFTMGLTRGDYFPSWGVYNSALANQLKVIQADNPAWASATTPWPLAPARSATIHAAFARVSVNFNPGTAAAKSYIGYVNGNPASEIRLQPGGPGAAVLHVAVSADTGPVVSPPTTSSAQPNMANVMMQTTGGTATSGQLPPFDVAITPMEVGYFSLKNGRVKNNSFCAEAGCGPSAEQMSLFFSVNPSGIGSASVLNMYVNGSIPSLSATNFSPGSQGIGGFGGFTDAPVQPAEITPDPNGILGSDYASLISTCPTIKQSTRDQSFQPAAWSQSFSESTRLSWNFANPTNIGAAANNPPSLGPAFNFPWGAVSTQNAQVFTSATDNQFVIAATKDVCQVQADATYVSGFLACDVFEVLPRSSVLIIIGTVIAGRLNIDPSAIDSGIIWRSVYHPQSIVDLQQKSILQPYNTATLCNTYSATNPNPIWNPNLSAVDAADAIQCSSVWLRHQAEPFTWTQIDPDCGVASSTVGSVTCRHRPQNFTVHEIGRSGNL